MKTLFLSIALCLCMTSQTRSQAQSKKIDLNTKPRAGKAPIIQLGDIKSFVLRNGLKVFVVENHQFPTINIALKLNIRPDLEKDNAGTANIAGELLTCGTKTRTKDDIDEEIDFIGASIQSSATGMTAFALTKHQDKLFNLFTDMLFHSDFKQSELDKIKKRTMSYLATQKENPDVIATNVKKVLNYSAQHPYGEMTTEQSVQNITIEKCTQYYTTFYKPNVAYLSIVGDVQFEEIKNKITQQFEQWMPDTSLHKHTFTTPTAPEQSRFCVVNKNGAVQTVIHITYPLNIKPNDTNLIKLKVLNTLLGGSSSARLFMNLREKHGYTYGAYSSLTDDELIGQFSAYAKVRTAVTDSAIKEFLFEINQLKQQRVSAEELTNVKNYLMGNFAIDLENPSLIADYAIHIDRYQLPPDYFKTYLQRLAAVSVNDIYDMAQKYLSADKANIVLVGNQKMITEQIQKQYPQTPIQVYDYYGRLVP